MEKNFHKENELLKKKFSDQNKNFSFLFHKSISFDNFFAIKQWLLKTKIKKVRPGVKIANNKKIG